MTVPDRYSAVQSAAGVAARPRDRRGTVAIRDGAAPVARPGRDAGGALDRGIPVGHGHRDQLALTARSSSRTETP